MAAALGTLAVVTEGSAPPRLQGRSGGAHATSSIPAGVGECAIDAAGAPARDRSLFDHYSHRWNAAGSDFQRRLVVYEAEREITELRRAPARLNADQLQGRILAPENVGIESLEIAVILRVALKFVRWLRADVGRDPDFGWRV